MKRLIGIIIVVLFAGTTINCAKARHVAVGADYAFSQAVFAFDDAELAACQSKVLSAQQCAALDPVVKQLLVDVKAATLALQASPKDAKVPAALPDLLTHLSAAQKVLAPLQGAGGPAGELSARLSVAVDEAIKVVRLFTGGK